MQNELMAFRRHALLPKRKPGQNHRPYLPAFNPDMLAFATRPLTAPDRRVLRAICETGDVLMVDGVPFILAPVNADILDALAIFEADIEDRELDLEDEDDGTGDEEDDPREISEEDEDEHDAEPEDHMCPGDEVMPD